MKKSKSNNVKSPSTTGSAESLRVLVCIPCLLTGGTEVQTLSLVEALKWCGYEVGVACYFEYNAEMVARYSAAGARVWCMSKSGDAPRPAGALKTLQFLRRGFSEIRREWHPDVAHIQYMAPGALAILALRAAGIRNIVATTHTGADIYSAKGLKLLRFIARHWLAAFQCITLIAEKGYFGSGELLDTKQSFARKGNHFTIHNTLPSAIHIADTAREEGVSTIGVVSRLERIKGMDMVVPAFAAVQARHPDLRLIVAGDGTLREEMEKQVEQFSLPDGSVSFLGRVESENLEEVYDNIDILLMPSRSEGFGLTALEGMARGCVPVVARTGGLPEVVVHRHTGLIHNPEDVEDMSLKIERLIESAEWHSEMSKAAIERSKIFSNEEYRRLVAKMYHRLFQ